MTTSTKKPFLESWNTLSDEIKLYLLRYTVHSERGLLSYDFLPYDIPHDLPSYSNVKL
jgi:hypothetical protein